MTTKEITLIFIVCLSFFVGITLGNGTFSTSTVNLNETEQVVRTANKIAENTRNLTSIRMYPSHHLEVVVYPTTIKVVDFSKQNKVKRKVPNVQDDNDDDSWHNKNVMVNEIASSVYTLNTHESTAVKNITVNLTNLNFQDLV